MKNKIKDCLVKVRDHIEKHFLVYNLIAGIILFPFVILAMFLFFVNGMFGVGFLECLSQELIVFDPFEMAQVVAFSSYIFSWCCLMWSFEYISELVHTVFELCRQRKNKKDI